MRVVLPRETDTAVNLNVLRRAVEIRLGTERLREARRNRQFIVALLGGPGRVVGRRLRRLNVEEHVRALVLDRLERSDRPTELHAVLRVFHGVVEHPLCAADLFSGQRRGGRLQRRLEAGERFALDTDERGRCVLQHDPTLLARLVHRREHFALHTLRVALNSEERETLDGHSRHEDDRRRVAVGDVTAHAVDDEAVAGRTRGGRGLREVPETGVVGQRHGGDRLARRDARQVRCLVRVGADEEHGVRGEGDGREVRRAKERGTHLFEYHVELDRTVALTTELLGNAKSLERQLFGHLIPDGGVVALGGGHQTAYFGFGRFLF